MINFIRLLILMFVVTILCGCDNHQKIAKKTDYKQSIIRAAQQNIAAFVPIKLGPYPAAGYAESPLINTLIVRGWLKPVHLLGIKYDFASTKYLYFPRLVFKPTPRGKPYFNHHCTRWGYWRFCSMVVKVGKTKLISFQQHKPMATIRGITTVNFKYSYYVQPYPWFKHLMLKNSAKHSELAVFAERCGTAKEPLSATITLFFSKQAGWQTNQD